MLALIVRLLATTGPTIAVLVAAAFVLPADCPFLPRQVLLAAVGIGGIALGETLVFRTPVRELAVRFGFKATNTTSILTCLAVSLPIWLFLPIATIIGGAPIQVAGDWPVIVLGVILVNGVAEEVIHRAVFFGRLRERSRFAVAATLGAVLFGAQHLYLIATIGVPGIASVGLALFLAYPLCRAFEMGRGSIVGPTILHTSANAAFLVFGTAANSGLLMLHMLVVLASVYAVFLVRPPRQASTSARRRDSRFALILGDQND